MNKPPYTVRSKAEINKLRMSFAEKIVNGTSIKQAAKECGLESPYYQYRKAKPYIKKFEERVVKQSSRSIIAVREEALSTLAQIMRNSTNDFTRAHAAKEILKQSERAEEILLKYSLEEDDERKNKQIVVQLPFRDDDIDENESEEDTF